MEIGGSGIGMTACACSPSCHEEATLAFPEDVRLISSDYRHLFPINLKTRLEENGFLRKTKGLHVCMACINYARIYMKDVEKEGATGSKQPRDTADGRPEVKKILEDIYNGTTTPNELELIAKAIGHAVSADLNRRAGVTAVEERVNVMKTTSYEDMWKNNQNSVLRSFLEGILQTKSQNLEDDSRSKRFLVKSVESIYCCLNKRFISNLSLAENLALYYYSGSRNACDLLGHVQASGSYTTVLRTSNSLCSIPPTVPSGDIFVVFDNIQVIGKQYRVSYQGKQPISTVTAISIFKDTDDMNFQRTFTMPNVLDLSDSAELQQKRAKFKNVASRTHYNFGKNFIESRMIKIKSEMADVSDENHEIPPPTGLNYDRVETRESSVEVMDLPCVLVNPNSEARILEVLNYIKNALEKDDQDRKWYICVCDGLPFTMATRLIRDTYYCEICNIDMNRKDVSTHMAEDVHRLRSPSCSTPERKFKKIVMRPGNGHYEINLVRAIFRVYFDIYILPVAILLGFTTPRALEYCKSAVDHHKSWMILQIVFESLSDELLYPYVLECSQSNQEPSAEGYFNWKEHIQNPNYSVASDFVFTILHPLFLFRAAIRGCNDEVALIAREKASAIFYGNNNPKYRQINAHDLFYTLSLPEIGSSMIRVQSVRSHSSAVGQGLDFQLEERNKLTLGWLHSDGAPNPEQWRRATQSLTEMEQIRNRVNSNLKIGSEGNRPRKTNLSTEITKAREHFRSLNLFTKENQVLVTATTEKRLLAPNFVEAISLCEKNREKYYDAFLAGKKVNLVELLPKATKDLTDGEIKRQVRLMLSQLPEILFSHYDEAYKKVGNNREEMNELYCALEEELAEAESKEMSLYSQVDLE